jgi:hypothetical protein
MESEIGIGTLVRVASSVDDDSHVGQTGRVVRYRSDSGHKQFGVIFPKATSSSVSWYDAEGLIIEGGHNDWIDITFTEAEFRQMCRLARRRARSLDPKDLFLSLLVTLRNALIFADALGGVPGGYSTMADAYLNAAIELIQRHMKLSFSPSAAINEELLDIRE